MINIRRSQPAPPCLSVEKEKKNGDYKCGEVIQILSEEFHDKCYLCEDKNLKNIQIDHLKPHKGNKDLMFDWNNLFYSCPHCNNTKSDKFDNIIDCSDKLKIVTNLLKFEYTGESYITIVKITALIKNDIQINQTEELLNKIYNGTTKLKSKECESICKDLNYEIDLFNSYLIDYYKNRHNGSKDKIIEHLKPDSAFTAFKIWIIKSKETYFNEFGDFKNLRIIYDIKKNIVNFVVYFFAGVAQLVRATES